MHPSALGKPARDVWSEIDRVVDLVAALAGGAAGDAPAR
jgi:hypothetical protein